MVSGLCASSRLQCRTGEDKIRLAYLLRPGYILDLERSTDQLFPGLLLFVVQLGGGLVEGFLAQLGHLLHGGALSSSLMSWVNSPRISSMDSVTIA